MRKAYNKPTIHFEDFALVQTTASSCGENVDITQANHGSIEQCGWNVEGIEFFTSAAVCDWAVEDGMMDGICYNNPAGGYNIFSS